MAMVPGAAAAAASASGSAGGAAAGGEAARKVLVFKGWGVKEPGVTEAFMKVLSAHDCEVLDIAQFVLEGSVMFTFVLQLRDEGSTGLMEELTGCAKGCGVHLDFHFPDSSQVKPAGVGNTGDNAAVLSIVSTGEITPALLCGLDDVLGEHGCVVTDIKQRSENKLEENGEYNKVELHISCPPRLKLATLSVGPSTADESLAGLQKVAWDHGAEMTIRWWDAMNRPNSKSLVVFGISHELCRCRVLDEILKEAGCDPIVPDEQSENQGEKVLALLKGKSATVVQKVIDRLEFAPGARFVCGALKRLGFRLALLTDLGFKKVAEHFKRELGMDYVISRDLEVVDGHFTGKYTGEMTDVRFRKADLLTLMAEREGIDHRNVIIIGQETTHLKAQKARQIIETFGPNLYFNAQKMKDLTIALYLLGFNSSDVMVLHKRMHDDAAKCTGVQAAPSGNHFRVQVSARTRAPGQIRRILSPLSLLQPAVQISTISQCSLQDGGMCIGLDLRLGEQNEDLITKELLQACQMEGFQVLSIGKDTSPAARQTTAADGSSSSGVQHVITLVQKPQLTAASLSIIFGLLRRRSVSVARIQRLSVQVLAALQLTVCLPEDTVVAEFSAELVEASKALDIDIAFQKDDLDRCMRRLVVFDMDSTLIQQEVIDELAKIAGVETEVKALTEAAMRGELNFFESLKSRVALLKGHNAEELFDKIKANIIFTPGARTLCSALRRLGYKTAVISGGFLPVAREVQRYLGLDYAFANTLEVDEMGLLTGRTSGPVVTPQRKRALLATIADVEGCELQQTIAVGDGANDIPMLNAAGLGIAFCAKPKVQAAAEFRINQKDLSTVLFLIGVSEEAAQRLAHEG